MKTALVCGAGGFIGGHLVKRLKLDGFWVRGVDIKPHEFCPSEADEFVVGDLRDPAVIASVIDRSFDEVYQLAADMGGAGYINTGENDAAVMHNSAMINLSVLEACRTRSIKGVFFSSSACVYPEFNQEDPDNPDCREDTTYPAAPDSEYGWEKLFSERMYLAYNRNFGMRNKIARYHNIFGPEGTWEGGKEKAPAAMCRKVAQAENGSFIEVWGDGLQTRSFLFVDECIEGTVRLMRSDFDGPVNIGSDEMIAMNALALMVIDFSGKQLAIRNVPGPVGVRGRNSNNALIKERLDWSPHLPLRDGMNETYAWINDCVRSSHATAV
ncbi:MAG: NAD-dependent epimerase/dehydratase family protein [Pseudomonadota bacterium]